MANKYFLGDAPAASQVTHVTPALCEVGDKLKLTINRKTITFTVVATAVASICASLRDAINASSIPEWQEITASLGTNDAGIGTHVVLTGPSDGTPFTVTSATTNLSVFNLTITEVQKGSAAQNQKQRLRLLGPPTGGTFTLTFGGATTGAIAYNASAATVLAALEALANIAPGDVTVTLNATSDWTVEFTGVFAADKQPLLLGSGASLTGGAGVVITVVQQERTANYAKGPLYSLEADVDDESQVNSFRFKFTGDPGSFTGLAYYSDWVANGDAGATADDIRIALESIRVPATLVSDTATKDPPPANTQAYTAVDVTGPAGGPWNILIREGVSAGFVGAALSIDDNVYEEPGVASTGFVTLAIIAEPSTTAINEIQHISLTNVPLGGTFTLSYAGQTTGAIAYNASAATVEAALEALSTIGAVLTVTGSGTLADPWAVVFAIFNVQKITGSGSSLTGSTVLAEIIQDAASGVNEQQEVAITGGVPTGGTFTLTLNAQTTSGIAYNATAATVQAAIEALAAPVPGDILCTGGPLPTNPVMVEFQGAYVSSDVAIMTGSGASLTASNTQTLTVSANIVEPTGPNYWDDPLNWSGGTLPTTGDKAYVANIATDILYGLDGITDTLAEVHFDSSFTGQFGLRPVNESGYYEYRQLYGNVNATLVVVGEGNGAGSSYININAGTVQTELIVYGTGSPDDSSIPALLWKGTHASNVARIFKGSFGAAVFTGEVATIATLQIGYLTDAEADVEYAIGGGVTLTTIQISGGDGSIALDTANATSFRLTGGTCVITGTFGVSTTFIAEGESTVVWKTTGTLGGAPVLAKEATFDASQDMRTKTITNPIEVYSENVRIIDPFQTISNLRIDANYTDVIVNGSNLGTNVRLTRGTPS